MISLETDRLLLRDFTPDDLPAIHRILDVQLLWAGENVTPALRWERIRGHQLNQQQGFGMLAVVIKATGELIGQISLHTRIDVYGQFPSLQLHGATSADLRSTEVGIGYALAPEHWGHGYASEAAHALAHYAFTALHVWRIVSMTERGNHRSLRVMKKIGMTIERNERDVEWPAYAGVIYHPEVRR